MAQQHYRHYRVAKRSNIPSKDSLCSLMACLMDNPLIFLGMALLVILLLKRLFCPRL